MKFVLISDVVGPHNTRTLTVLGWTDDIKILNVPVHYTLYPVHVQTTHQNSWLRSITLDVHGSEQQRYYHQSIFHEFWWVVWTWTGYNVALSIFISSVQPSTVSVRVLCGPTTCRASENEVSAMNMFTRKSDSEYVANLRLKSIQISWAAAIS